MTTTTVPDILVVSDTTHEPPYRILVHNDNITPFDFVITVLRTIFGLSSELAEHITWTAHTRGVALVMVRPRQEAQRLVAKAHMAARLERFPLTFSLEPET